MSEMNLVAEPGKHAVTFTCLFDAPRNLVFKTYTDRHAVPQWWGPGSHKTVVDKMEVKPGGMWRYVSRGPDGNEYAFHGVYHLVVKPAQLVSTFEFEGLPERHVSLETANFETQADGGTQAYRHLRLPVGRGPRRPAQGRNGRRTVRIDGPPGRAPGRAQSRVVGHDRGFRRLCNLPQRSTPSNRSLHAARDYGRPSANPPPRDRFGLSPGPRYSIPPSVFFLDIS